MKKKLKSDFLEEESINSLIENEIYYNLLSKNIVRWKNSKGGNYLGSGCTIYKSDYSGNFHNNVKQYRLTTPEEKHWFLECEKANKFIPYDKAMETFGKPKPFKFNIGDEIKAKLGGYYFCDPERFKEQHKILLPSSESRILGKITERTQAQGFNWYRCGHDNWRTEEGVELVKEDIPEYDKCINTSKSLVGRYLKALVDYPNAGSVLKGEIGIITEEYKGIPLGVDFPSQKYYGINGITYKKGKSYELMPEGFKLEDDLISEAKKRYPIGTKFRPAHVPGSVITEYCIVTEDSIFEKDGGRIVLTVNGRRWVQRGNLKYGNTDYNRHVYYEGKWAEIVSDEPEINTYGLKVGDILKQEIIDAWAGIEGNFCPDVQTGWVDVFCGYGEGRKIEDFRDIDGQIGFHVSGCTEGTHYLKAEGFKEFADNFYKKKEKEGMLEMLAYPKDNYFKAVVVKDILKKDITTKGDMPDLIPKGYQTWFRDVGTYHRGNIFQSSEYLIFPEDNRWRANIPAEYFEIVEDEKHNDIPKECYSSNEIIIPQVIKAQKTIQKITIESPTELDLKLKTIKPKQIQTIKI